MTKLTRDAIVAAAFDQLAESGLDGITARALADRLGVRAGALYYHLPDMAALRDEMATVIMRELILGTADASAASDWPGFVRGVAGRVRAVLLGYRDGAALFSGTRLTDDDAIGSMETPLRVLTEAGFSLPDALVAMQTVTSFVTGFVIEEQHRAGAPDGYTAEDRARRIDAGRFPLTAAANADFLAPADAVFRAGVDIIVAGLAASR